MTSRERLLSCIKGLPVDRVPVSTYELNGWDINAPENSDPSYTRLMEAIREQTDCVYMANPAVLNEYKHVKETWRDGRSVYMRTIYESPKGCLTSLTREDDDVRTQWTLEHLLKTLDDIDAYLSLPWEPPIYDIDKFYEQQRYLGDRGVMMISVPDPICVAAELFEMGQCLELIVTETAVMKRFLDALHERQQAELDALLHNDMRDVLFRVVGPEYATPPYLNPSYFPEFVTVYIKDICARIRNAGGLPRIHCHGKIARVLDEFLKTDAVAIDPVEPPPDGDLTLVEAKSRCGDRFCLFGNIELRELECSSGDRINVLVKQAMDAAKPGGRFILMPTAAPINTPLSPRTEENYLHMFETAEAYGRY